MPSITSANVGKTIGRKVGDKKPKKALVVHRIRKQTKKK